jgi:hypothetical protein
MYPHFTLNANQTKGFQKYTTGITILAYYGDLILMGRDCIVNLFHLGISCTVFVLICTVMVLNCFVMCVCVCVGVCVLVW